MLGLDVRRPELAGFVARKKDDAPCFFRIAFKHKALPPWLPQGSPLMRLRPSPGKPLAPSSLCNQPATASMARKRRFETLKPLRFRYQRNSSSLDRQRLQCLTTNITFRSSSPAAEVLVNSRHLLARKRLRRQLLHASTLQPQHPMT